MNALTRLCLWSTLTLAMCAAPPLVAQEAMHGMHMSHSSGHAGQHASKATSGEAAAPAQHMSGMHMSSTQDDSMTSSPNLTGAIETLDVGAQIGVRPVVRGLDSGGMKMPMHDMQMQGAQAPPHARSADYSDGIGDGSMPGMAGMGDLVLGKVMLDHLEYSHGRDETGIALDAQGWYGTDANKLWLKADAQSGAGRLHELRVEAMWDRPISAYWDAQLGVRHDFGVGPGRTWAAFGVQGLAPYWFDVEATAYIGQAGRTAFRFETEYELLITQRLILEPDIEVNLYGRDDTQRGIGSGLSDVALGLRLRYEVTRQFAPYVGVAWTRKFGKSADYARAAGEPVLDSRVVVGLRAWF